MRRNRKSSSSSSGCGRELAFLFLNPGAVGRSASCWSHGMGPWRTPHQKVTGTTGRTCSPCRNSRGLQSCPSCISKPWEPDRLCLTTSVTCWVSYLCILHFVSRTGSLVFASINGCFVVGNRCFILWLLVSSGMTTHLTVTWHFTSWFSQLFT